MVRLTIGVIIVTVGLLGAGLAMVLAVISIVEWQWTLFFVDLLLGALDGLCIGAAVKWLIGLP